MRRLPDPNPIGALFDAFFAGAQGQIGPPTRLSIERIRRILSRVEYKPGWVIRADVGGKQRRPPAVVLFYEVPTVERDTKQPTRLTFTLTYEGFTSEEQLVSTVMSNLLALEDHEAREFFVYDGERVYDPHAVTTRDPKEG
jgi:hypothetical protein